MSLNVNSNYLTLVEVSPYWKRFTDPLVRSRLEESEHAILLRGLAQRRFNIDPRGVASGVWEDGPQDFSRPWLCKFDYHKLTSHPISLSTVGTLLPDRYIVEPGKVDLSSYKISRALNAKNSKKTFGIFNLPQNHLNITNPPWLLKNSIVHIVNSRNCPKCPEWLPLDNYVQMATAWTYSDFHLDQGHTGAYVGMIEGEKLVLLILNRIGLHKMYVEWDRRKYSYKNEKSYWFPMFVPNCVIIVIRVKGGECLYIPPGCVHSVLTLKSSITISGNFFHKDFIKGIAYTWNYEFLGAHPGECNLSVCHCDSTPNGYNKRVCTLLARFAALAVNGDVEISQADKSILAQYLSEWTAKSVKHANYLAFHKHQIERCECTMDIDLIIKLLNNRKIKDFRLPSQGGNWPGWKSPQPVTITVSKERHFTDVFQELAPKRPRL